MIDLWLVTITGFSNFSRASRLIRPRLFAFPTSWSKSNIFPLFIQFVQFPHVEKTASTRIEKILISRCFYVCYMSHFISLIMEGFLCLNCASNSIYLCPRHTDSTLNICLRLFSYLFCLIRYPRLKNIWEH